MIDSPTSHIADIQILLGQYSTTADVEEKNKEIIQKTENILRGSAVSSCFLRMSWLHKLKFLKDISEKIRSASSIYLLLSTLHCVTGKISFYARASTKPAMPFDTILQDHDRMLTEKIVETVWFRDIAWFETMNDQDQVALVIFLLRLSGGAITEKLYKHLQKLYGRRLREGSLTEMKSSCTLKKEHGKMVVELRNEPKEKNSDILSCVYATFEHDPEDPNHKQFLKLSKKWEERINAYRKEVEKNTISDEKSGGKKDQEKGKKKKGKKDKKSKKNKKSKKKAGDTVDWVQLMPIWIVKKIFGYLDKKTLTKAKKVNEYWKWAITDLMKEQKARKALAKAIKKLKESSVGSDVISKNSEEPVLMKQPRKRLSALEKRMRDLYRRGAILEKLRHISTGPLSGDCLIIKALEVAPCSVHYLDEINMQERVIRTNKPLYKKPEFIFKDYKLICRDMADMNSIDDSPILTSEYSSMGSEEIEF